MFTIDTPTTLTTISELRKNAKQTVAASQERPVVLLVDGQPVAALISMEQLRTLQELEENERLARVAARRLQKVRAGEDPLLEHDDFWAAVEARKSGRAVAVGG